MTPKPILQRRAVERGMMIVPLLMILFLIASLTVLLIKDGRRESGDIDHAESRLRAQEAAEVGLLLAEMELRGGVDKDGDGIGNVTGSFGEGTYEVVATLMDPADQRYELSAIGRRENAVRRIEVSIRVLFDSLFQHTLFGKDWVEFTGTTDSWDSELGPYAAQRVNVDGKGPYAGGKGSLGSNGHIKLKSKKRTIVRGDAKPGPASTVKDPGNVTGDTTPRTESLDVATPPIEDFIVAMNSNANGTWIGPDIDYDPASYEIKVKSGGITFPSGTYFFNSFDISPSGPVRVTGPVKIYVVGDIKWHGDVVINDGGSPADFLIIAYPHDVIPDAKSRKGKGKISLKVGSGSMFAIYAPGHDLDLSCKGEVYGAVVAKSIRAKSKEGSFHYDEALGRIRTGDPATSELLYSIEK